MRQFHKDHKPTKAKKFTEFVHSAFDKNAFWVSDLVSAICWREDENGKRLTAKEIIAITQSFGAEIVDDAE
jgi:hypothetical protein